MKRLLLFSSMLFSLAICSFGQSKPAKEYIVTFRKPLGGIMYVDILKKEGQYHVHGYDQNGLLSSFSFGTIPSPSDEAALKRLLEKKDMEVERITYDTYSSNPFAYNSSNKRAHKKGTLRLDDAYFIESGNLNQLASGTYNGNGTFYILGDRVFGYVKCIVSHTRNNSYKVDLEYKDKQKRPLIDVSFECDPDGQVIKSFKREQASVEGEVSFKQYQIKGKATIDEILYVWESSR